MIKFFSRLPMWALYAFSTFLYLLAFYVVRHRHQVIREQLEKVFPVGDKLNKWLAKVGSDTFCELNRVLKILPE